MTRGEPGGVRIWIGRAGDELAPEDLELLDARELGRMELLHDPVRRAWYAGARAGIRRIVGEQLRADPRRVRWGVRGCPGCGQEGHGPPYISAPPTDWEVSVSRSDSWWMVALSEGAPVGVDIEQLRAQPLDGVMRRGLSARERAYVGSRPAPARLESLLRCWVRKEAVVKGWGTGLATELSELEVRPDDEVALVVRRTGNGRACWTVTDVPAGPGCVAALSRPVEATGPVTVRSLAVSAQV